MRPDVASRCIDGGAGIDGCRRSELVEVNNADVWVAAIRLDADRYHGVSGAVMLDGLSSLLRSHDAASPTATKCWRHGDRRSLVGDPIALPPQLASPFDLFLEEVIRELDT